MMAYDLYLYSTMLYHLIMLNPHRDVTLHVAANNPAMVRFTSD